MFRLVLIVFIASSAAVLAAPISAEVWINEFVACNTLGIMDEDEDFPDWIEIFNPGPGYVNLLGYGLTDDPGQLFKWVFPSTLLQPGGHLLLFASGKNRCLGELHTNFKLDADGETLTLTDNYGNILDSIEFGALPADLSLGRRPVSGPELYFFREPTPGEANLSFAYQGLANRPAFTLAPGFYEDAQSIEIFAYPPDATIYYSTDGSMPDTGGLEYTGPLVLSETTVLRACCMIDSLIPRVSTGSYIFNEGQELTAVSIVTDPYNLWDEDYGIYVLGDNHDPDPPYLGANFWENWERPAHLEFFTKEGELGFSQDIGIKIHGGWSRAWPQKSLRLLARSGYGQECIEYRLFPDKEIDEFKRLILRNAGNDWCESHFRDALIQSTSTGWDLDYQAYQPALVFLNGEYWGVQNFRERMDKYYLASNHGADPDAVDILDNGNSAMEGSTDHYDMMIDYIETHGLEEEQHYEYIRTLMDTDNFAAYNAFEIFYGNCDWPNWNVRCWRAHEPGSRWRWMLLDLDAGLYLLSECDYEHNTLAEALDPAQPEATFLLRKLMENARFRRDFINRYADLINSQFRSEVLLEKLSEFRQRIETEMPKHLNRWDFTYYHWLNHLYRIGLFIERRAPHARSHITSQFGLSEIVTLSLDILPPGAGRIQLTALSIEEFWSGIYFTGNPVHLTALPNPGYAFQAWSDEDLPADAEIWLDLEDDYSLTANFRYSAESLPVINEINYHSADDFDPGDWIELHNPWPQNLDLSSWQLRDSEDDHVFLIPPGIFLPAEGYLVLCRNLADFSELFPGVENCIGNFDFGFSSQGERVRLFDDEGGLMDWVEYGVTDPWPGEPNGFGPTLELSCPFVDNSTAQYWHASMGHGTPGEQNSCFLVSVDHHPHSGGFIGSYPNPFNPDTRIRFNLSASGSVQLAVYDIVGRRVRTLVDRDLPAGEHEVIWDGKNSRGEELSTGIYLGNLATEDRHYTWKLILLR